MADTTAVSGWWRRYRVTTLSVSGGLRASCGYFGRWVGCVAGVLRRDSCDVKIRPSESTTEENTGLARYWARPVFRKPITDLRLLFLSAARTGRPVDPPPRGRTRSFDILAGSVKMRKNTYRTVERRNDRANRTSGRGSDERLRLVVREL